MKWTRKQMNRIAEQEFTRVERALLIALQGLTETEPYASECTCSKAYDQALTAWTEAVLTDPRPAIPEEVVELIAIRQGLRLPDGWRWKLSGYLSAFPGDPVTQTYFTLHWLVQTIKEAER